MEPNHDAKSKADEPEQLEIAKHDVPYDGQLAMPPNLAALSDEEYRKLGRKATLKMDLVIMPILVIMYILNYLDRQNIASAKLANIQRDLGLRGVQYQTAVSILFVGYSKWHSSLIESSS